MMMFEAAPKHRHPSLSAEVQECSPLDADALGSALYGLGSVGSSAEVLALLAALTPKVPANS